MASELRILDVGHGNSTLILSEKNCIIDCPGNTVLLDTLIEKKIKHIDIVLVSHADADHLVGITNILLSKDISVGALRENPNSERTSLAFKTFLVAVEDAISRGVDAKSSLTAESPGVMNLGEVSLEVLSPGGASAFVGVGGTDISGNAITTNAASAVIKVVKDGVSKALLPGDMSSATLLDLRRRGIDLHAEILIFPHHGGTPEYGDATEFAKTLIEAVDPQLVIFSLGRGRYGTPRPEIVNAIRETKPNAHIACTQLSKSCAADITGLDYNHLDTAPAHGKKTNACCAGTITFALDEAAETHLGLKNHYDWIGKNISDSLCTKPLAAK
ncbi:ComEC/Rec2 family competence protein [Rhizobium ruizarguesonis]